MRSLDTQPVASKAIAILQELSGESVRTRHLLDCRLIKPCSHPRTGSVKRVLLYADILCKRIAKLPETCETATASREMRLQKHIKALLGM